LNNGTCVEAASVAWQRSSFCSTGACVAAARVGEEILVRDSKVEGGPILSFTRAEWSAFIAGVDAGEMRFTE
jgi:uncharacterized protein DUF397